MDEIDIFSKEKKGHPASKFVVFFIYYRLER
jgi:hypothetical protein